jgi:hypothetical protein
MADPQSVAQAESQLASANEAATAANNDLAYRKKVLSQVDENVALARQAVLGKTTDSPEYQYYQGTLAQQQTAADAVTVAQQNANTANNNVATAAENLTTAQQAAAAASSQTAGDAATTNANPATQNTGTDSGNQADPVTQEEAANQSDTNNQDPSPVPVVGTNLFAGQAPESKSDIPQGAPAKQVGGPSGSNNTAADNPLDAYTSYTYGLTLHVLTKEDYNTMVSTPKDFKPTKTLISSANRYNGPNQRDPAFADDFYFDNLKMNTVIGLNANARGTNSISVDFTIIEPYGMTLLDRLMDINNTGLNGKNYLDMPYLLEINFFGYDDNGKVTKIDKQTKWIPIKIIGFKIKAGVKGAEYAIQAVPFNHSANLETVQAIKARFEVTATTVGDYFSSTAGLSETSTAVNQAIDEDTQRKEKLKAAAEDTQARQEAANKKATEGDQSGSNEIDSAANGNSGVRTPEKVKPTDPGIPNEPITVNTKSFTTAYNLWNLTERQNGNIGYADQIAFNFLDKDIEASTIVDAKKNSARKVAAVDAKTTAKSTSDGKDATPAVTANFDSIVHSLDAGTTVNDVINIVLQQSQWFKDQLNDPSTQNKDTSNAGSTTDQETLKQNSKPLKMWKIVPSVKLYDFDTERNCWGKTVTFNIGSYAVHNNRDDRAPKSVPPKAVKKYEYFYTGQNRSIVSFDIDFNALYFTAINVDKGKTSSTNVSQTTDEKKLKDKKTNDTSKTIDQNQYHPIANSYQTSAGGANDQSNSQNAASVVQSQYTSAAGDMINLKMQILGDPHFIKQDDIFYSPAVIKTPGQQFVEDTGSLTMDEGEIYCEVTFKTPTDVNDKTGLYDLNTAGKYRKSEFSGYYKVLTVESTFANGKFLQTLNLVRYPKQDPQNTNLRPTMQNDPRRLDLAKTDPTNNSQVSGDNVDKAPDSLPPAPTKVAKTEDADRVNAGTASGSDLDAAFAGDVPNTPEDQQLAAVADMPESKTVDEATSSDGNTVPIQFA